MLHQSHETFISKPAGWLAWLVEILRENQSCVPPNLLSLAQSTHTHVDSWWNMNHLNMKLKRLMNIFKRWRKEKQKDMKIFRKLMGRSGHGKPAQWLHTHRIQVKTGKAASGWGQNKFLEFQEFLSAVGVKWNKWWHSELDIFSHEIRFERKEKNRCDEPEMVDSVVIISVRWEEPGKRF